MSSNPVSGYTGFENPDEQYYGTAPTLPVLFTGTYQVRQFGVGGSRYNPNVLSALKSPPANMVTAAGKVLKASVVTDNDQFNYWPAGTGGITGGTP